MKGFSLFVNQDTPKENQEKKMLQSAVFTIMALVPTVYCHFRVPYPGERNATNWLTQAQGPCGGANEVVLPRYPWNPRGSPLDIGLHHELSVGAVYYCPGNQCQDLADFNITLLDAWDIVGAGNFCIPSIDIPYGVGSVGTIQVVTTSPGEAVGEYEEFFNCVDIVISNEGPSYNGSQCTNSSSVEITPDDINNSRLYNATSITLFDAYQQSTRTASTLSTADAMSGMDMSGMSMDGTSMVMASSVALSTSSAASNSTSSASASLGLASSLQFPSVQFIVGILLMCL